MKSDTLIQIIKDYNFNYFGIQEINMHDKILPPQQKWKRKFHNICTTAATNQHSSSKRRILHGGTGHFLDAQLSLRQMECGQDPTHLGRWCWTFLRGKQGIQVRVISGYRPVEDRSNRPHTVFSQHEYYFNTIDTPPPHRNPRTAFYEDLDVAIQKWLEEGDLIILGLDANEDIHSGETMHWINTWGLTDVMRTTHPDTIRVATCNKNYRNVPIDGIWCSPGLQVEAAGMTGFGEITQIRIIECYG